MGDATPRVASSDGYVLEKLPVGIPTAPVDTKLDLADIVAELLQRLPKLCERDFIDEAVWRDSVALTGTFRTFYGASHISNVWKELSTLRAVDTIELKTPAYLGGIPGNPSSWVVIDVNFKTAKAPRTSCLASFSMVPGRDGDWKIWMLTTYLHQLEGHPDIDQQRPREDFLNEPSSQHLDVVIVGAGQAGLSVGARLHALNVSYVLIDRIAEVGDNWMQRYDSTRLHTTREFAHLPFGRTFSPDYQEYLTKFDIANGFKEWTNKHKIHMWLSTTLENGVWDRDRGVYDLTISRHQHKFQVVCRHVVIATGGYGPKAFYPEYENKDQFKGLIMHSEEYKSSKDWKGKAGVVIGTANTAHDVASDMVAASMKSVHLVQRERTYVIPASHFKALADGLYNTHTPTDLADRLAYAPPWAVSRLFYQAVLHPLAANEPERYQSLERAKFRVTQFGDLIFNLAVRRGGHYMDVGCSRLISDGLINVQSGALPVRYHNDGLECSDGTFIPADVVVFATGFSGSLNDTIRGFFGDEVAGNIGPFWGLDEEGEIRGAFKPTGQPGMWCAAGTIGHSRYHSRFIGLHIRAELDDTPFPVYDK